MILNRRDFLAKSAAAMLALNAVRPSFARPGFAQTTIDSLPHLKELAAAAGLIYGSDSDVSITKPPADAAEYATLFAAQCALYAPLFLWADKKAVSTGSQVWEDPNISFARAHGLKLTGGHLVWHRETPAWMADLTPKDAEDAIVRYIAELGQRFGSILYSWNVVNEAIEPNDGRSDGLRKTVCLEKFGTDYFDFAAHAAKEAAPGALRVYNDYAMDFSDDKSEQRRQALLLLLDEFKKRNTPIQAIGLQSHLRLDGHTFDENIYSKFLKEISDRGFIILITELDVFDIKTSGSIATRDQMVADLYARLLNTALENQSVKAVVTWGLSDRYTWLNPNYDPHYIRSDGQPSRPLPFDANLQPKPAFWALVNAFKNAPKRHPTP
jgi:endo-1,4-beta-xylanase